ncbi:hypothetical protein D3C75_1129560 [compost metagenome]
MIGIHQLAIAHGKAAAGAFNFKTELTIQRNGTLIVGVHRELNALNTGPVVADIDHRLHQRAANAFAVVTGIHADANSGHMAAAYPLVEFHKQLPHHAIVNAGHHVVGSGLHISNTLLPHGF